MKENIGLNELLFKIQKLMRDSDVELRNASISAPASVYDATGVLIELYRTLGKAYERFGRYQIEIRIPNLKDFHDNIVVPFNKIKEAQGLTQGRAMQEAARVFVLTRELQQRAAIVIEKLKKEESPNLRALFDALTRKEYAFGISSQARFSPKHRTEIARLELEIRNLKQEIERMKQVDYIHMISKDLDVAREIVAIYTEYASISEVAHVAKGSPLWDFGKYAYLAKLRVAGEEAEAAKLESEPKPERSSRQGPRASKGWRERATA
ncbi:hypothetical protein HY844_01185 [Candidatus Berkelbacteria bacterium]|nr:hypothetical protein [Candidatus Berkelbacteria bacterium]